MLLHLYGIPDWKWLYCFIPSDCLWPQQPQWILSGVASWQWLSMYPFQYSPPTTYHYNSPDKSCQEVHPGSGYQHTLPDIHHWLLIITMVLINLARRCILAAVINIPFPISTYHSFGSLKSLFRTVILLAVDLFGKIYKVGYFGQA